MSNNFSNILLEDSNAFFIILLEISNDFSKTLGRRQTQKRFILTNNGRNTINYLK
jgi:hypothetical protein